MFQIDSERQFFEMLNAEHGEYQGLPIQAAQAGDPVQKLYRGISKAELNRILAAHTKWLKSRGKAGQMATLERVNLQGVNLARANLQGANLAGADLRGANPFRANLRGADLSGTNLQKSFLEEANLQEAILEGANLQEAHLAGANLKGADLAGAQLQQANLRGANLENANLVMANLQKANLEDTMIVNTNLRFSNLQHANLKHAKIFFVDLEKADLIGAKGLDISQLSNVKNLSQANLYPELKRQIRNGPLPSESSTIRKASVLSAAAEPKLPQNRLQDDRDLRRQPRRPFSKPVFMASQNQYSKGHIKDINSFGAFIETSTQFSRQQVIKLEIPETKMNLGAIIICEVARADLHGIGVKFKKLIQSSTFSKDMGGMRSGTDRRKLLFSEYYPEKRSGVDRRSEVDRRKLKYIKYYKYGLQLNRIVDNGGRRFTRDRRRISFVLYWPENRSGSDRRSGKDRRTVSKTKVIKKRR